jgi:exosome complex component RRP41
MAKEAKETTKRPDGRSASETRPMTAKVGVVPNADGSALFAFGDTIAIAAVYGPKQLHPQHLQNPETGVLRCNYSMLSFSVAERAKPGPNRRSTEISKITEWSLLPALKLELFPGTVVDVHINILQADASTRCAGINAASLALAHAGLPMKGFVNSVSIGKIDKQLIVDVSKEEEDWEEGEGATDMPFAFSQGKLTLAQLDGYVKPEQYREAYELAKKTCDKIEELQKEALKSVVEKA